jgi:hypothetical protein
VFTKPKLRITSSALQRAHEFAKRHKNQECLGIGAGHGPAGIIEHVRLLPAVTTTASATASPLAVRELITRFRREALQPTLLWHSHASFGVFHSGTDDSTVSRLLPALAEAAFQRPAPSWKQPTITGPDSAIIPLPDGRTQMITVAGAVVSDTGFQFRSRWTRIVHRCGGPQAPRITILPERIHLGGGGMSVELGVEGGATVTARLVDAAPIRVAHLYSLVVNNRGDQYAEAITVIEDQTGESSIQQAECDIEVVDDALPNTGETATVNGRRLGGTAHVRP